MSPRLRRGPWGWQEGERSKLPGPAGSVFASLHLHTDLQCESLRKQLAPLSRGAVGASGGQGALCVRSRSLPWALACSRYLGAEISLSSMCSRGEAGGKLPWLLPTCLPGEVSVLLGQATGPSLEEAGEGWPLAGRCGRTDFIKTGRRCAWGHNTLRDPGRCFNFF